MKYLMILLVMLLTACDGNMKADAAKMKGQAEKLTQPDGTIYEKGTIDVDGGENSEGLEASLTPEGITLNSEGSYQSLDLSLLVGYGWVRLIGGLILCGMMLYFKTAFLGDVIPNSAPALFIVSGAMMAFGTEYMVLLTSWLVIAIITLIDLSVIFPGWWNNLMRIKAR